MTEASSQAGQSGSQSQGGEQNGQQQGGNGQQQQNNGGQQQQPGADGRPAYVPEKFWDPATKAVKSEDVFKSYSELEKRMSTPRYDVPDDKAAPEARTAWEKSVFKALGVPEAPEAYGLAPPEGYPEHMGEYMKETLGEFGKVAHGLNMTPAQAKGVQTWFDGMALKLGEAGVASQKADTEAANARMDGHFTKIFGDQKGVAVEQVKQAMTKAIPDAAVRADLEKALPNEALVVIAALDKHYKETYGKSDENQGDGGNSSGKTVAELREDAQKLMSSPEYRDPMHKDHKSTKDKVNQAYKDIAALTDQAKKK